MDTFQAQEMNNKPVSSRSVIIILSIFLSFVIGVFVAVIYFKQIVKAPSPSTSGIDNTIDQSPSRILPIDTKSDALLSGNILYTLGGRVTKYEAAGEKLGE